MTARIRVRFAKRGDLRLIGHRDLVRAFERMFRRIGVNLAMSQGFHPRPLMTFPDALGVGIEAENEVMDIALDEEIDAAELLTRMNEQSPPGLVITDAQILGENDRKAKVKRTVYELSIPVHTDRELLAREIDHLKTQDTLTVDRKEKQVNLDLKETLDGLWVDDGRLMMSILVAPQSQLRPRDILAAIGLRDAIREGAILTRTQIELST